MELINLFVDSLKQFNITLSDNQIKQFMDYKDLLLDWNEKINLTAITDPKDIIIKHFVDSLSVYGYLDKDDKKIIDIGTGAGFPGIPMKILDPTLDITLVDATNKRVNFLNEVITALDLKNIKTVHARAEELANTNEHREVYDVCVSRALANLRALTELSLGFVKVNGKFISLKGPKVIEEIPEAQRAIDFLGGKLSQTAKIPLPDGNNHYVVVINKIKKTPKKFPRNMGKISKQHI